MGNFMSLIQLPKVIEAVNELALKVQKLEIQVQSILNNIHNLPKATKPAAPKPQSSKKNDIL